MELVVIAFIIIAAALLLLAIIAPFFVNWIRSGAEGRGARNGYEQIEMLPDAEREIEIGSSDGVDEEDREEMEGEFWHGFERS